MSTGKRYYWLKLKEDFFRDRDIKKLRSMAGGDTLTVIYLEMLLLALPTDGKLEYTGLEDDFASEIALTIDENPDNVNSVVSFLEKRGLLTECNPDEYELTAHKSMIGSETDSAQRMRRLRHNVTNERHIVRECDTEKEKEKEKDSEDRDQIPERRERTPTTTDSTYTGTPAGGGAGGDGLPPEILEYARNAARGAEHPAAYERRILQRIQEAGLTTLEQVLEADRKWKEQNVPQPGPDDDKFARKNGKQIGDDFRDFFPAPV